MNVKGAVGKIKKETIILFSFNKGLDMSMLWKLWAKAKEKLQTCNQRLIRKCFEQGTKYFFTNSNNSFRVCGLCIKAKTF